MPAVPIPQAMILLLRVLIDDIAAVTFTDNTLSLVLAVAGRFVVQEMTFASPYYFDVTGPTVNPDPTDSVGMTVDDSLINLTCLKAACISDRGQAKTSAGQAVDISDAGSRISVGGIAQARIKLLQVGWCAVYDDEKMQYLSGQSRVAGAAVMTPFRVFAGDNAGTGYFPYEGRSAFNPFP